MYKSRFIIQANTRNSWFDAIWIDYIDHESKYIISNIPSNSNLEILMKTKLSVELETDNYEQV